MQHPQGKSTHAASGKILKITNTIEFNHNADTDYASSGSPVILFSNNKVIGIHKKRGSGNYNEGTFIGELIEGLSKLALDFKTLVTVVVANGLIIVVVVVVECGLLLNLTGLV